MCGIVGMVNWPDDLGFAQRMLSLSSHRGPDNQSIAEFSTTNERVVFGHNRLSIIDLSDEGNQPMESQDGRFVMVFNGEVYNYKELRKRLQDQYVFKSSSDSEVVLAAYSIWGKKCLEEFIGMFAIAIWDKHKRSLFIARDRFGVKPLYYITRPDGIAFSSEIKPLQEKGGVRKTPNEEVWKEYFVNSRYDHTEKLFWRDIEKLAPGHYLEFKDGKIQSLEKWYDISQKIASFEGDRDAARERLVEILEDSIKLRFRSDVPVGVCLSGGLDSSLLVALIQNLKGRDAELNAFTFYTGYEDYDELPWVEQMMGKTRFKLHKCHLDYREVPRLTEQISWAMEEPFGGIPTLAMTKVFQEAKSKGLKVLLDGNGMDEGWAGYDYYRIANKVDPNKGPIQQSTSKANLHPTLSLDFLEASELPSPVGFHSDPLLNLQIRDLSSAKIPRSMRFADRNSMLQSIELREPFLDHRLMELGLSVPKEWKINGNQGKVLVREVANSYLSDGIRLAPKRGVQTPQREWFQNELKPWIEERMEILFNGPVKHWFNEKESRILWQRYLSGEFDNSFFVWQWINTSYLIQ